MNWAERFPLPTSPEPTDPGPLPKQGWPTTKEGYEDEKRWHKLMHERAVWVQRVRCHAVAVGIEEIEERVKGDAMMPADLIAYVTGLAYLEECEQAAEAGRSTALRSLEIAAHRGVFVHGEKRP